MMDEFDQPMTYKQVLNEYFVKCKGKHINSSNTIKYLIKQGLTKDEAKKFYRMLNNDKDIERVPHNGRYIPVGYEKKYVRVCVNDGPLSQRSLRSLQKDEEYNLDFSDTETSND